MIGLDTNVLVRYLVRDDPEQSAIASTTVRGLTESAPGFISIVTVVELYWVLRRAYKLETRQCQDLIQALLDARELRVDHHSIVSAALTASRTGIGFADAIIVELGRVAGCEHTVTFDQQAAQQGGMRLLQP